MAHMSSDCCSGILVTPFVGFDIEAKAPKPARHLEGARLLNHFLHVGTPSGRRMRELRGVVSRERILTASHAKVRRSRKTTPSTKRVSIAATTKTVTQRTSAQRAQN